MGNRLYRFYFQTSLLLSNKLIPVSSPTQNWAFQLSTWYTARLTSFGDVRDQFGRPASSYWMALQRKSNVTRRCDDLHPWRRWSIPSNFKCGSIAYWKLHLRCPKSSGSSEPWGNINCPWYGWPVPSHCYTLLLLLYFFFLFF